MFHKMDYIIGNAEVLNNIRAQRPYEIFSERTIQFLDSLSIALRGNRRLNFQGESSGREGANLSMTEQKKLRARSFPDVAAFGFWCRRASVLEMGKKYAVMGNGFGRRYRIGRGVSLHFVSSNIPTLFGYSMAAALLAGDCVLVRLPSKRTPQEDRIVEALQTVMEKQPVWKERIVLFRSPRERKITDALSAMCDVRVIWGGDRAVREIRQSPLPPRALELPFADRRSAAVFLAEAVLETEDLTGLVRAFYNDTYRNDQNACSSPHLLFWMGEEAMVKQAQERFWRAVAETIEILPRKESAEMRTPVQNAGLAYQIQPAIAVKKWEQALYLAAAQKQQIPDESEFVSEKTGEISDDISNESTTETSKDILNKNVADILNENDTEISGETKTWSARISRCGNLAVIVEPESLTAQIWEETVPGGFFFQSSGTDLTALLPALSRKVQTLTCFGVDREALAAQLVMAGMTGVDRIVEVGHALDFSLVWDGMDLIGQMSREIAV